LTLLVCTGFLNNALGIFFLVHTWIFFCRRVSRAFFVVVAARRESIAKYERSERTHADNTLANTSTVEIELNEHTSAKRQTGKTGAACSRTTTTCGGNPFERGPAYAPVCVCVGVLAHTRWSRCQAVLSAGERKAAIGW